MTRGAMVRPRRAQRSRERSSHGRPLAVSCTIGVHRSSRCSGSQAEQFGDGENEVREGKSRELIGRTVLAEFAVVRRGG